MSALSTLPVGKPRAVPLVNRIVMGLLGSPWHRLLGGKLLVLRYTARSGAKIMLPVQAAAGDDGRLVVMAGNAGEKQWWHHFRTAAPVEVLRNGHWHAGIGRVAAGSPAEAAAGYRKTFPRATMPAEPTFVLVTLQGDVPSAVLHPSRLMRVWWPTVTAAEFAGFAVPASIGALIADARPAIGIPALLAAGAVEGSMLGWGQASVLRRALPDLAGRRWIVATALAAVFAYMLGLVPSTFHDSVSSWPVPIIVAGAVVLGTVLLASIGTAQWFILRQHVASAGRWIAATALAWAVGLGVFLGFATPLWQPGQPTGLAVLIGVGGGLLMAATTSAITGLALRRLLGRQVLRRS